MKRKGMKRKLHTAGKIVLALFVILGLGFGYNCWMNAMFVTNFYTVESDKVTKSVRIVELSDLHLSEFGQDNEKLVQRIRGLAPDIIAVAGDMNIDENEDYSIVTTLMEQLVKIAPVYYAPGNHEWASIYAFHYTDLPDDLEALGVHWMNQTYEDIEVNGNTIRIGGFFEWPRTELEREGSKKVADALNDNKDAYNVLICHCPEVLKTSLRKDKFDLVLSGHAHGGQVRLPFTDGLWSTSQGFLPKYTSGVRKMGKSKVVISRGLGDSEPWPRINNQPELVVVDIH